MCGGACPVAARPVACSSTLISSLGFCPHSIIMHRFCFGKLAGLAAHGRHSFAHTHRSFHIPPLLGNGTRVLIYAGDVDFICNWLGNQAWTLGLEWPSKAAFNSEGAHAWSVDEAVVRACFNKAPSYTRR